MAETMMIKSLILKLAPTFLLNLYSNFKRRERRKCFGRENPDKKFYIIGFDAEVYGMWGIINNVLMNVAYAESKGYIPIVDYLNHKTQYTQKGEFGVVNFWEKIFMQPTKYKLDDVKHSKCVIFAKREFCPSKKFLMGLFYNDEKKLFYFRNLFHKYIVFNELIKKDFESRWKMIAENRRIVGCLLRGTDYVLKKPKNHPVQPSPEIVCEKIKLVMQDYNCERVFLATEDADILELAKEKFGNSLLYIEQFRMSKKEMNPQTFLYSNKKAASKNMNLLKDALDYLFATYALSRCNCFISGITGGMKGVLLMTEGFEYQYIYDLGLYE